LNHPFALVILEVLAMVDILRPQAVSALARDKVLWQEALQISVRGSVLGTEVMLRRHCKGEEHVDSPNLLVIDSWRPIGLLLDANPDDTSHITNACIHGRPNLSAFPKSVVSSICSEGENQTDNNTQRADWI
jgi:hypothetical protein